MDQWCSGRLLCNVMVYRRIEFGNPCAEQLPNYLQARYNNLYVNRKYKDYVYRKMLVQEYLKK